MAQDEAKPTATLAAVTRKESKRFVKFLVVGTSGFVVDFGAFNILYRVFGLQGDLARLAQTISFTLAATNNYIWNRHWTYPESRSKPIAKQYVQFFALNLIAWLVRTPIFELLRQPMAGLVMSMSSGPLAFLVRFATETLSMTLVQLGDNIALGCAVIVVMFWNFFANRFITYSDVKIGH
jgi:putative flippase GtrA